MTTALLVTVLGLMAAIAWGISDFFSAKAAKQFGPAAGILLVTLVVAITYELVYALVLRQYHRLPIDGIGYAAAGGCLQLGGSILFFIGLKAGPVSIVSPVTSVYPLVTTVLALAIFHASLGGRQLVGIALVVLGVIVAAGLLTARGVKGRIGRGPAFALMTALAWGVSYTFLAQAVKVGDWQAVTAVEFAAGILAVLMLVPLIKGGEVITWRLVRKNLFNKFVLGAGIVQLVGFGAVNIGLAKSTASAGAVIVAISSCYPILTIFLALKHFNERVGVIPLAGAAVGITGVVLLALG